MKTVGKAFAVVAMAVPFAIGFTGCSSDDDSSSSSVSALSFETITSTAYKEKWTEISSNFEQTSMNPGSDITKMNYAWYSKTESEAKMRISKSASSIENAAEITGTSEAYKEMTINDESVQFYANKVTVTNLNENTKYCNP